jgi:tungstate transport system ATP-binding protein
MTLRLSASNISKKYNGEQILRDCSFSFSEHGIYVLTGANGCGKSTFLRICALIEEPDSGEINYFSNGSMVRKTLELKRSITLVLPKVGVFNTTVFKNAAYGLMIRGKKGKEVKERVMKSLDFVELGRKMDQNALTLSSGETQRLGIARALAIDPRILFLDEPTASVDQKNTKIIENIILNMKTDKTSTVVITTHDREQAERLADIMMVIRDGRILP